MLAKYTSLFIGLALLTSSAMAAPSQVQILKVPNGGIQPQAVKDSKGTIHLIYFKGEKANAGNLFYVKQPPGSQYFSQPLRVNSIPNTSCAAGTVRGGQIAIGKGGRVHVVWNGLGSDYTRMNDAGTAFEPQRNVMTITKYADGGCTLAADKTGNVFVAWHGNLKSEEGEGNRRLWVAKSANDGKIFSQEKSAWNKPTGVCACCSTRALADSKDNLNILYRSATDKVNRDTYLLTSTNEARSFTGSMVQKWTVPG